RDQPVVDRRALPPRDRQRRRPDRLRRRAGAQALAAAARIQRSMSVKQQRQYAETLRGLHVPGDPLVLVNIWDPGSAKVVAAEGARAIATGSWAVAVAFGSSDGQNLPFELAVDNLRRIVASVDLPVSIDLESGYGDGLDDLQTSVAAVIDAGAVGINIEDLNHAARALYGVDEQAGRIAAVRAAADELGLPLFINARTDT